MSDIKIRCGHLLEQNPRRRVSDTDDTMFHHSFNPIFNFSERLWRPHMDIFETPDEIIIRAEVAGVAPQDLDIEVSENALRISGKRAESSPISGATYRLVEIQSGSFERLLKLPRTVDTTKVTANYTNGFLKINLVKQSC